MNAEGCLQEASSRLAADFRFPPHCLEYYTWIGLHVVVDCGQHVSELTVNCSLLQWGCVAAGQSDHVTTRVKNKVKITHTKRQMLYIAYINIVRFYIDIT